MNLNLANVFNNEKVIEQDVQIEPCRITDHIPRIDPTYVFELNLLNDVLLYLFHPYKDCLYISGPSGCGKTTMILQIAARLNWGVEQITLSNKCESLDLIGHSTLRNGELVFEYGPLSRAMINGEILILNEIDLMSAGDLSVLNDVLDGKSLTVLANGGEIIHPHPQFRVIATANTKGFGDMTGFYNGTRQMNQAFLDRWRFIEMDYPKESVERALLKNAFPDLSDDICTKLIAFSNEIRKVVKQGFDNGVRQISAPFSSRNLLKIASIASLKTQMSIHRIIKMCYSLRLPAVECEYVMRLCNDIFGHEKNVLKKTSVNNLNEEISQNDSQITATKVRSKRKKITE